MWLSIEVRNVFWSAYGSKMVQSLEAISDQRSIKIPMFVLGISVIVRGCKLFIVLTGSLAESMNE